MLRKTKENRQVEVDKENLEYLAEVHGSEIIELYEKYKSLINSNQGLLPKEKREYEYICEHLNIMKSYGDNRWWKTALNDDKQNIITMCYEQLKLLGKVKLISEEKLFDGLSELLGRPIYTCLLLLRFDEIFGEVCRLSQLAKEF